MRIWDEHFYLFLFPVIPFFLLWFRRGYIAYGLLILLFPTSDLKAFTEHFKNSNELAKEAFDAGDYETACNLFDDCYQKGVCYYKLGCFENAEAMFKQNDSIHDSYNLGNSLAKQMTKDKLKEALTAYDDVLEQNPDHMRAKENREIVKKLLEEQEQEKPDNQDQQDQDQQDNQDQDDEPQEPKQEQDSKEQEKKEQNCKDQDADLWLDRIQNDPKTFLKNKFQIESMKNGTKEAVDPW
jgi:Ca-activated chloride channel family protein